MSDLTTLHEGLQLYLDAERKILETGESVTTPDDFTYNRGNLVDLQREIRRIRGEISTLDSSGGYSAQAFVFGGWRRWW